MRDGSLSMPQIKIITNGQLISCYDKGERRFVYNLEEAGIALHHLDVSYSIKSLHTRARTLERNLKGLDKKLQRKKGRRTIDEHGITNITNEIDEFLRTRIGERPAIDDGTMMESSDTIT